MSQPSGVPEMLTSTSGAEDYVRVITSLQGEMYQLRQHLDGVMAAVTQQSANQNQGMREAKELTRWRSIQSVPKFSGEEKHFRDFEFKLQQFIRPVNGFEKFLNWVKDSDLEPNNNMMTIYKQQTGVELEYLNDQLFGVLSVVTEGTALQTIMNVVDNHDLRGAQAWHRMTRDATGKTGARLKRLADKVHRPAKITGYHEALSQLTEWDNALKELAKIEGQGLSELTKITTLTHMIPVDLQRAVESDKSIKSFSDTWNYVMEQIEVRKHWTRPSTKKDPNAMDLDAAEREEANQEGEEPGPCMPCDEPLDTLKGGGKGGVFQGYCGYCNAWGHKRADCRKRLADLAKGGKGKDGKGKEGGKDGEQGKGKPSWGPSAGKGNWNGGWQMKGKGKNPGFKGKGFGGGMYNIDGEYGHGNNGGLWDGYGSFSNGFFGCLLEESDNEGPDDSEDDLDQISEIPVNSENSNSNVTATKIIDSFKFKTFADFLAASRELPNESIESVVSPEKMSPKEEFPELVKEDVSVARYKKKKNQRKTERGTKPEQVANECTEDSTVLNFSLDDLAIEQSELINFQVHTHL